MVQNIAKSFETPAPATIFNSILVWLFNNNKNIRKY